MSIPPGMANPDPERVDDASPAQEPADWSEALGSLFDARVALAKHEGQIAVKAFGRRAAALAVAAIAAVFAWALVVAGGIGALASLSHAWAWYWIALVVALVHALVAALAIKLAKSRAPGPTFPLTRAEFQKDRAWLKHLKSPRNSPH